jgi:phosphoribosylglycinamide formyltransferase-1
MKIGVFAYNFEHWKTQEGLLNLFLNGRKPEIVFAANKVKLNFYHSKIRVAPKDLFLQHPQHICEKLEIPYHVLPHDSASTVNLIKAYDLDVGIILGARILKKPTIDAFKKGIINMHPGILPMNRGLDNLKWAVYNKMPMGVTAHLIDDKIDRGQMIKQDTIKVYADDTLVDVHIRLQNLEQKLMLESLDMLESPNFEPKDLGKGTYYKAMPEKEESNLITKFKAYKKLGLPEDRI